PPAGVAPPEDFVSMSVIRGSVKMLIELPNAKISKCARCHEGDCGDLMPPLTAPLCVCSAFVGWLLKSIPKRIGF
ncbi:MAG: hypothetical protein KDE24_22095, partial [Caldilinea sp.]|nr:hypothetical protein [Caldilinea sp.]